MRIRLRHRQTDARTTSLGRTQITARRQRQQQQVAAAGDIGEPVSAWPSILAAARREAARLRARAHAQNEEAHARTHTHTDTRTRCRTRARAQTDRQTYRQTVEQRQRDTLLIEEHNITLSIKTSIISGDDDDDGAYYAPPIIDNDKRLESITTQQFKVPARRNRGIKRASERKRANEAT